MARMVPSFMNLGSRSPTRLEAPDAVLVRRGEH